MVLFKGVARRLSPRFHFFVSDVIQRRSRMGSRFSCVVAGMARFSLDFTQADKNIVEF